MAIVEYVATDMLALAGNYALRHSRTYIELGDLREVVCPRGSPRRCQNRTANAMSSGLK